MLGKGGINVISSFIATDVALPDGCQKKRENLSEKTTIEKGIRGVSKTASSSLTFFVFWAK